MGSEADEAYERLQLAIRRLDQAWGAARNKHAMTCDAGSMSTMSGPEPR